MSRSSAHDISAALLVLVVLLIMNARSKLFPSSQAVHWLGAALSGALLVSIGVWASITIVGNASADGIGSASPVLVILLVMEACGVVTPLSNTVNRLAAFLGVTFNKSVNMRTLNASQSCLSADSIRSAPLILVTSSNVLAARVRLPLSNAIHRLAATTLGAVLETILIWTRISVVQGNLTHCVCAASLILMIILLVQARCIVAPRSNTVHGLSALLGGALLKFVSVWASITIVGRSDSDLVESALLVLVSFLVMEALSISIPRPNTIHRLRATRCRALLVVVAVCAAITIVSSVGAVLVVPAPPVLVVCGVVVAWSVRIPRSSTVHRLNTSRSRALNLVVSVWALLAIACWGGGDLVGPATLILVTIRVVLASSVRTPLALAINRLAATRLGAVLLSICVGACITIVLSHLSD